MTCEFAPPLASYIAQVVRGSTMTTNSSKLLEQVLLRVSRGGEPWDSPTGTVWGGAGRWIRRASAQADSTVPDPGNFLQTTSALCRRMGENLAGEAPMPLLLSAEMWWTASERRIRPASLSLWEAVCSSALPTFSQEKVPGWKKRGERELP